MMTTNFRPPSVPLVTVLPKVIAAKELDYYMHKLNRYGLPLDSRSCQNELPSGINGQMRSVRLTLAIRDYF